MQIGTRFSVSLHILLCVEVFKTERKVTSDFIAGSVNTNPVVIRRLMGQLKDAGLIEIAAGTGGITLTRPAAAITLLDVFRASDALRQDSLFRIHEDTAPGCAVGGNIADLLGGYFAGAQASLEAELARTSLADLLSDLARLQASRA